MQRKCQTFLGERLVPAEHFIGLPAPRQSVGQADVLAGPRDPPPYLARGTAGTRAIQPATHAKGSSPWLPPGQSGSAGRNKTCLGLLIPRLPQVGAGEEAFRRLPESFALSGLAEATRRARDAAGRSPPPGARGQVGAGSEPRGAASALTSGKKLSIVPARPPTCRRPASGSRSSAQHKVPGNHACHGATRRNSSPRGSPVAIAFCLLVFRTFCLPKP